MGIYFDCVKNERYCRFLKNRALPTNGTRKKGSLPFAHYYYFYFPFNIPLPDNAAAERFPRWDEPFMILTVSLGRYIRS